MNEAIPDKCSRCGSEQIVDTYYAACTSRSKWSTHLYSRYNARWVNDSIILWPITLCGDCISKAYEDFSSARRKTALKVLKWSGLVILGGIAAAIPMTNLYRSHQITWGTQSPDPLLSIILYVITFALYVILFAAIVVLIFYIIRYAKSSKKPRGRIIPKERYINAFRGEADRILKTLEGDNKDTIFGDYDLPKYKNVNEYPKNIKDILGNYRTNRMETMRSVIAVSRTMEELRESMPAEWKQLLKSPSRLG